MNNQKILQKTINKESYMNNKYYKDNTTNATKYKICKKY